MSEPAFGALGANSDLERDKLAWGLADLLAARRPGGVIAVSRADAADVSRRQALHEG